MSKLLCNLTVVGEHQNAGSILVKTSHWEYSCRTTLEKVHYSFVCMRVACSSDISLRLVHYDVNLVLALESFSVETDVVGVDIYLGSELGDYFAVNCHHSSKDEIVSLSS